MTSQPAKSDSHEGFKQLGQHRDGCLAVRDGRPFVITDRDKPFDFHRKKNGHCGGSTMWWRFVCNDLACSAVLLVRWDEIMRFINDKLAASPSDKSD